MKWILVGIAFIGAALVGAIQAEDRTGPSGVIAASNTSRRRFEAAQRELTATGASSCASPNCHSGATPRSGEVFLGVEYDLWYARRQGSHFRAFKTLYDERSERMAKILYGPQAVATETTQCCACHALDVPEKLQGRTFNIEDGVTCEACHGRSEKWGSAHQNPEKWRKILTADQREAAGYDDMRDVVRRAEKCLECHAGTEEKRVTHTMMAAGHPPLTLDLASDLFDVPKHWKDQQSYLTEKEGSWFQARVWAVGQAVALRESMRRLAAWAASDEQPDFAAFECYACHHDLDEAKSWRQRRGFMTIPGSPVWDAGTAILCRPLIDVFLPDAKATFAARVAFLQKSLSVHGADRSTVGSAAEETAALADQLVAKIAVTEFDFDQTMRIMRKIVDQRGEISTQGYRTAEQAFAALYALYRLAIADSDKKPPNHEAILKCLVELESALYSTEATTDNQKKKRAAERYDPFVFMEIVERLAAQIGP